MWLTIENVCRLHRPSNFPPDIVTVVDGENKRYIPYPLRWKDLVAAVGPYGYPKQNIGPVKTTVYQDFSDDSVPVVHDGADALSGREKCPRCKHGELLLCESILPHTGATRSVRRSWCAWNASPTGKRAPDPWTGLLSTGSTTRCSPISMGRSAQGSVRSCSTGWTGSARSRRPVFPDVQKTTPYPGQTARNPKRGCLPKGPKVQFPQEGEKDLPCVSWTQVQYRAQMLHRGQARVDPRGGDPRPKGSLRKPIYARLPCGNGHAARRAGVFEPAHCHRSDVFPEAAEERNKILLLFDPIHENDHRSVRRSRDRHCQLLRASHARKGKNEDLPARRHRRPPAGIKTWSISARSRPSCGPGGGTRKFPLILRGVTFEGDPFPEVCDIVRQLIDIQYTRGAERIFFHLFNAMDRDWNSLTRQLFGFVVPREVGTNESLQTLKTLKGGGGNSHISQLVPLSRRAKEVIHAIYYRKPDYRPKYTRVLQAWLRHIQRYRTKKRKLEQKIAKMCPHSSPSFKLSPEVKSLESDISSFLSQERTPLPKEYGYNTKKKKKIDIMFLSARDAKPLLARSKQGRRLFNRSYRSGFRLVPSVRGGAERTPVRTPGRVSHTEAAAAPHPPDTEWSDRNKRYLPQSISFHEIPNGPGIYFLSNIETCPMREVDADDTIMKPSEIIDRNSSVPRLVKIGMAYDLKKRIDRYLLYYPNGVYLYGFISENPRLEPRPQKRFKKDLEDSDHESEYYSDIEGPTRHTALLEIFSQLAEQTRV